jgi:hypothetical protein
MAYDQKLADAERTIEDMQAEIDQLEAARTRDRVWVISEHVCGFGGDDDRKIIAVCTTAEKAYAIAVHHAGAEIHAYPLDEEIPDRFDLKV